jgi:hypothetical protein
LRRLRKARRYLKGSRGRTVRDCIRLQWWIESSQLPKTECEEWGTTMESVVGKLSFALLRPELSVLLQRNRTYERARNRW